MSKITEAQAILKALGLPAAQQNEMSALTLLALCSVKEDTPWAEATRTSQRITKSMFIMRTKYCFFLSVQGSSLLHR